MDNVKVTRYSGLITPLVEAATLYVDGAKQPVVPRYVKGGGTTGIITLTIPSVAYEVGVPRLIKFFGISSKTAKLFFDVTVNGALVASGNVLAYASGNKCNFSYGGTNVSSVEVITGPATQVLTLGVSGASYIGTVDMPGTVRLTLSTSSTVNIVCTSTSVVPVAFSDSILYTPATAGNFDTVIRLYDVIFFGSVPANASTIHNAGALIQ